MSGTFGDRTRKLAEQVGHGKLVGSVEVDQVYAKYQHEHPEFKHPEGGQAFYLRDPLFNDITGTMEKLAQKAITEQGSDIKDGMKDFTERLSSEVYDKAPLEFGDLKASGHPKVLDDGAVHYDRPPLVGRLSEEDLRAKGDLRRLGFGH